MKPLFEAKATFNKQRTFYKIFRLHPEKYKAQIVAKESAYNTTAPEELVLIKNNGTWQTEDSTHKELSSTLGIEIDVFNNGYGDVLGRIGLR
jgi:hypothetical protein